MVKREIVFSVHSFNKGIVNGFVWVQGKGWLESYPGCFSIVCSDFETQK